MLLLHIIFFFFEYSGDHRDLHSFPTRRSSDLPLQAKRALPDARASDLFVRLHGMLFTNIQLDDFQPTLSRFIERLERSEEHTSELQSHSDLVCRLLLEKKKKIQTYHQATHT